MLGRIRDQCTRRVYWPIAYPLLIVSIVSRDDDCQSATHLFHSLEQEASCVAERLACTKYSVVNSPFSSLRQPSLTDVDLLSSGTRVHTLSSTLTSHAATMAFLATVLGSFMLATTTLAHMSLDYPAAFNASNNPHRTTAADPYLEYPYNCCGEQDRWSYPCKSHQSLPCTDTDVVVQAVDMKSF